MKIFKNKFKAFTLAELLILMSILTILLAAMSPMITSRANAPVSDTDVWSFVDNDPYYDIHALSIQNDPDADYYIGTPLYNSSEKGANYPISAKLTVRTTPVSGALPQRHMDFRYGGGLTGSYLGSFLFVNNNLLLGGKYSNLTSTAEYNTAFGKDALEDITTGKNNTAFGSMALQSLKTGEDNTAVGYMTGLGVTSSDKNTYLGHYAGLKLSGAENIYVGAQEAENYQSHNASKNTFVGFNAGHSIESGTNNTGVGSRALQNLKNGSRNTAIGQGALANLESGNNNTALGKNACSGVNSGSNKTCIGNDSGAYDVRNVLNDDEERVFIGSRPKSSSFRNNSVAVLEVHNPNTVSSNGLRPDSKTKLGNATVIINGDLIIRGQTFFKGRYYYPALFNQVVTPMGPTKNAYIDEYNPVSEHALMGLYIDDALPWDGGYAKQEGYFMGTDGFHSAKGIHDLADPDNENHPVPHRNVGGRAGCVCAYSLTPKSSQNYYTDYNMNGVTSYDWNSKVQPLFGETTKPLGNNELVHPAWASYAYQVQLPIPAIYNHPYAGFYQNSMNAVTDWWTETGWRSEGHYNRLIFRYTHWGSGALAYGYNALASAVLSDFALEESNVRWKLGKAQTFPSAIFYTDKSNNIKIPTYYNPIFGYADLNAAHVRNGPQTCCPDLSGLSDARLKNIGAEFTGGLDEIKKLKVYDYTFKFDKTKKQFVGVIAQDLAKIFPNAVSKNVDGYYKIRWDEIFYSLINSVKELNFRIVNIGIRVSDDMERISQLKKKNSELNAKLDELEKQLDNIEKSLAK